ncbi:uncharacterized protein EKO05_0007054 [Ascochyta rabiei]|uniref:Uncharacterized protein n=1 Tax=Didymella rabiei TaxID=5454 RepID=A0A163G4T8_DIDRA|nr:uncharacterized protein EKO05_0007054 [Ascochyta rabiei]KZM24677.1 hypothetical protein ST47_g4195 [Ascochyta rabiei]UPX16665.1 hypothetical protein EKO05_0007054 [Ascochyta rabiei]
MADRFKNLAKGGWHPEKSKASGSGAASDSRLGQVKGWVGKAKGKDSHAEAAREHQSAPLSTLKDPSTFAPPPKRIPGASPVSGSAPPAPARQRLQAQEEGQRGAEQEAPPQGPYRTDTTGLSTAHLPKPPAFRPSAATPPAPASRAKPPGLPPRLPPRQTENVDEYTPPAPPSYGEAIQIQQPAAHTLNQGAMNRLGQAGVSVPGLGIGRNASPPVPPRQRTRAPPPPPARQTSSPSMAAPMSSPAAASNGAQLKELQNRFAKVTTPSSAETAPSTGTSWADKQAALKTASNLRNDPSKVSASDLKGAATTANHFQQRHGEQAASGWRAASGLNQKYGIAGRVNHLAGGSSTSSAPQAPAPEGVGKKAPPPPPAKRKELTCTNSGEPPPIPLSSKPKF